MYCTPNGNEAGLVALWDFEEGSGNTIFDKSVFLNDGTIFGATYSNNVIIKLVN